MNSDSSSDLPGQMTEGKTARPGRVDMSESEMQALTKRDWNSDEGKRQLAVKGATRPAFGAQNSG